METLLAKLRGFSRQLELEDSIPYWERQQPELKARISEMERNRRQKEQELQDLQNPGFLQKIFGRTEDKKEILRKQIQEISAAQTAAQWEQESLVKRITAGKRELADLADSRTDYEEAKAGTVLTPAQESRLVMEEISAFAPAALETAERILEALENARFWIQKGQRHGVMEYLQDVVPAAIRLRGILSVLPEGVATVGSCLLSPDGYFSGDLQLERLCQAQEQIQIIRNQLRLLLGE